MLGVLEAEDEGDADADRVSLVVRAADALAIGLGLDLSARQQLARCNRDACTAAGLLDEDSARLEHRQRSRSLSAWLTGAQADVFTPGLVTLRKAARAVADSLDADARTTLQEKLPALLHMQAVRLAGADASSEALANYLWQRVLEGLAARGALVRA